MNYEQNVGILREFLGTTAAVCACYNIGTARDERRKTMEIQNNESMTADDSKQMRLAYSMVISGRAIDELLGECGISEEEFTAWVLDGSFADCAAGITSKMNGVYAPYFLYCLLDCAKKGSVPAIKLFFELFERKGLFGKSSGGSVSADPEIETLREDLFGSAE